MKLASEDDVKQTREPDGGTSEVEGKSHCKNCEACRAGLEYVY